jgi:hypothetical protein
MNKITKKFLITLLVVILTGCSQPANNSSNNSPDQKINSIPQPTYTSLPTYTVFPTKTALPTITSTSTKELPTETPTQTLIPTNTITPTKIPRIGTEIMCGDVFSVTIFYIPLLTKSQSYETATGKFMLLRLHIKNLSSKSWASGFHEDSFKLYGDYEDQKLTFSLDTSTTFSTNYRWEIKNYSDPVPPTVLIDTYAVFDVTPNAKNWVFEFRPIENSGDSPVCEVQIPLSKVEMK